MKRFVLYDTFKEERGNVDLRLCHVYPTRHAEEELVKKVESIALDPSARYRESNVINPKKYTMKGLRLPDDKNARDWLLSLSQPKAMAVWPTLGTKKVYFLMTQFKNYEDIDYCAGVFARQDKARASMDPGDRIVFALLNKVDPMFFLSEHPSDTPRDLWQIDDED